MLAKKIEIFSQNLMVHHFRIPGNYIVCMYSVQHYVHSMVMIWWWWFGWQKKGTRVQQGHMQGNTMAEIANFCPNIMRHLFLCTEQVALPVILKYSKFVLKYDWHEYLPGNVMHLFSCVPTFHHMRQLYYVVNIDFTKIICT